MWAPKEGQIQMVPVQTQADMRAIRDDSKQLTAQLRQAIADLDETEDTMYCPNYIWDICPL
jgi:hypothetical protein